MFPYIVFVLFFLLSAVPATLTWVPRAPPRSLWPWLLPSSPPSLCVGTGPVTEREGAS